jgi:prevent-host-death family protein
MGWGPRFVRGYEPRRGCLTKPVFGTTLTIDGQFQLGRRILGTTVSVAQARSQFAALVARAEAGEKIIVTRSGRAVACLGPLPGRQPIKYGELSGLFLSEDLTIPEEVIRDFEPSK